MLTKTLTIAGFDGSGGAGLQADLKTFSALGCYGMTVLTALPIQNTTGVRKCYSIPTQAVVEQLDSIFDDIIPDAIKIGMLFSHEIVAAVAEFLARRASGIPIVVDPVMVATSGDRLLQPNAIDALKHELFKLVTIVTPNLDEAAVIWGQAITTQQDMAAAGKEFLKLGAKAVLVKGGHLLGKSCSDLLLTNGASYWLESPRIDTQNTHGTGCTLAAAITANLALGMDLHTSCVQAKYYLTQALQSFQHQIIGKGHGPVNHFYAQWQ